VSRIFASWNQVDRWLRQVEGVEARSVSRSQAAIRENPALPDNGSWYEPETVSPVDSPVCPAGCEP